MNSPRRSLKRSRYLALTGAAAVLSSNQRHFPYGCPSMAGRWQGSRLERGG